MVVLIVAKQCSTKRTIQISEGLESSESASTPSPTHETHMSAVTVDVEAAKDDESDSSGSDIGRGSATVKV